MRPLPEVPASIVLVAAELDPSHSRRLEVWNYVSDASHEPPLDYVTLAVVADDGGDPLSMVTTRLSRKPDQLDGVQNGQRLLPAARLSILTVPVEAIDSLAPGEGARIDKVDQLLLALSHDDAPWLSTAVTIDGSPIDARVLRWGYGALWVGEYQEVTYSVISEAPWVEQLALRTLNSCEVEELTR